MDEQSQVPSIATRAARCRFFVFARLFVRVGLRSDAAHPSEAEQARAAISNVRRVRGLSFFVVFFKMFLSLLSVLGFFSFDRLQFSRVLLIRIGFLKHSQFYHADWTDFL